MLALRILVPACDASSLAGNVPRPLTSLFDDSQPYCNVYFRVLGHYYGEIYLP